MSLSAKPNFRVLGPRLGGRMRGVAEAVAALTHEQVDQLIEGATLEVEGERLTAADIVVRRDPLPGVIVAAGSVYSVAIDTALDDDLRSEGTARELINRVQRLRRDAGLDVSDRISVEWQSKAEPVAEAISRHRELIASEVLAVSIDRSQRSGGTDVDINGMRVRLAILRTD